jgi:hypothetical protein
VDGASEANVDSGAATSDVGDSPPQFDGAETSDAGATPSSDD